jgi:ribosomal protein L11 methyltransferase
VSSHREYDGGDWLLQCFSEHEVPLDVFRNIQPGEWSAEKIPDTDWLTASYKQFPAFDVGPFFIYGSHHDGKIPDDKIGLQIDAATAFGSGEHGTTKGCLLAMIDLKESGVCPWNVLDIGTGSGILGIGAWKLWKTPVLATDNDAEAVRVAAHHRDVNHVQADNTGMTCVTADGFSAAEVQAKKPFDLIIANILAVVLREMAGELKACSDKNGFIILSGILNSQAREVLDAYEPIGFALRNRFDIGEWSTLVLQNTSA